MNNLVYLVCRFTCRCHGLLLLLLVATHLSTAVGSAEAQTVWQAGTGDWFVPGNWTLGVPNSASPTAFDAIIANGGTAQLEAAGASVRRLRVGLVGGPGHLLIDGGNLTVTDNFHLNEGSAGAASVIVQGGSTVTAPDTVVGFNSAFDTSFLISGVGTVYNATNNFNVGRLGAGSASLTVDSGAVLSSVTSSIAPFSGAPGSNATVSGAGSRWSSTGAFNVGSGFVAGTLTIEDQGTVHVGTTLGINDFGNVNLNGGTLRFNTVSGLNRLNHTAGTIQLAGVRVFGTDSVIPVLFPGYTVHSGKGLTIEGDANIQTAVTINGGVLTTSSPIVRVGHANHGSVVVTNGGTVTANSNVFVGGIFDNYDGTITVSGVGSSLTSISSTFLGHVGSGTLQITGGGTVTNEANATLGSFGINGSGTATVNGAGSVWNIAGDLNLIGGSSGPGVLNIQNQGLVHVGAALTINSSNAVNLNGGTLRLNTVTGSSLNLLKYTHGTIQLAGNRDIGSDLIIQTIFGVDQTIAAGKELAVEGDATISSALTLNGGSLRATNLVVDGVLHFGGGLLELTGGTITGLSNLAIPTNGEFRASGVQSLRVTGATGSTITATGDLTLGNAAAVNGFGTQGTLAVGVNTVTLLDANDVVFDSLAHVTLGSGASPGTINAANGLTLNFGGNITGYGTIETADDPAKPLINNGNIIGSSLTEPITLTGYVKGVGTYDNVEFTGTFAPGFSPASVNLGSAMYDGTLQIEIGGLAPGSGHDQLNHILGDGVAYLGGTLEVSLLNGFLPTLGNTFEILTTIGGVQNNFVSEVLPNLGGGLGWNVVYGTNSVLLEVASATLPGDFDFDGDVDGRDFLIWQRNPGVGDLADWQAGYGGGAIAASVAVPEPCSMVLVIVVCGLIQIYQAPRSRQPLIPLSRGRAKRRTERNK